MMGYPKRVLESMQRIKEVIIAQQQALAEQRNYEKYKPPSEADDDGASFQDKVEGSGGFAGADAKKRRGVRLLLLGVATAAIELRPLNGVEVQMEHEPCATLADYVSLPVLAKINGMFTDIMTRLCQIDAKDGSEVFDNRVKPAAQGDESRLALTP
ncbi:MAG: hypothetical protein Q9170_000902 [Blastenia crenularia]